MPYSCCAPACKGSFTEESKVSVFSFPKDEDLKTKWIRAIPRSNLNVNKNTRVSYLININYTHSTYKYNMVNMPPENSGKY